MCFNLCNFFCCSLESQVLNTDGVCTVKWQYNFSITHKHIKDFSHCKGLHQFQNSAIHSIHMLQNHNVLQAKHLIFSTSFQNRHVSWTFWLDAVFSFAWATTYILLGLKEGYSVSRHSCLRCTVCTFTDKTNAHVPQTLEHECFWLSNIFSMSRMILFLPRAKQE